MLLKNIMNTSHNIFTFGTVVIPADPPKTEGIHPSTSSG
jgi:hypothetical protein